MQPGSPTEGPLPSPAAAPGAAERGGPRKGAHQIPGEVVLAAPYYAILLGEVIAMAALAALRGLRAGDALGHLVGWTGTLSMLAMHVYSLRRRVRALSRWGRMRSWLQVHIFLGLQGAMLVTFHSLHLQSATNLSGVTLVLTLVVVCSGVTGRYFFSLLPRGIAGERLSARAVEAELAALGPEVEAAPSSLAASEAVRVALAEVAAARAAIVAAGPAGVASIGALVGNDLRARAALRHLGQALARERGHHLGGDREAFGRYASVLRRRSAIALRLATLQGAERVFRGWTLFHKPLTFLLLGTVILHVLGHYLYGGYRR